MAGGGELRADRPYTVDGTLAMVCAEHTEATTLLGMNREVVR